MKIDINEFHFANDCAINATTKASMQNSVDKFSVANDNFCITISTKKTEVMHQPAPGKPYIQSNITIKGQQLKVVEKFPYRGNTHSKFIVMDDKVNARLAKASEAFCRLNRYVWNRRGFSEATKREVYQADVLTTLFYGCETWTTDK